jgi:hypothetical protein
MKNLEMIGSFSNIEALRLSSAVRLAFEDAANDLQGALDEREKNTDKTDDLKAQIKNLEIQLLDLPEIDLTNLRDALSISAAATEANRTLSESASEVKRLSLEAKDRHRELTSAPSDLDKTGNLLFPQKRLSVA